MSSALLEPSAVETLASRFSALGDPHRLRILGGLIGGQRCVCELQESLGLAPNLLSYHLRVLREAGLVETTRRGRWIDFRLAGSALETFRQGVPPERGA